MDFPENKQRKSLWLKLRIWFIGLLLLSALIGVVTHLGEIEHFAQLLRQIRPAWLIAALLLQFFTYVNVAAVWYLALRSVGNRISLISIIPLGIAKLFSDQVMPSGGISGTALFMSALNRRGIPTHLCMSALLMDLITYYIAYLLAALITVLLLYFYHSLHIIIVLVVLAFSIIAVGIPAGALWLRSHGKKDLPGYVKRIPGLSNLLNSISNSPDDMLRNPLLMISGTILQGSVFILDAATLWIMLKVLGVQVSFWAVFPGFIFASIVAIVSLIPLGLGTFEVTCVSMLSVFGVSIEASLTATLLLRGFTLWLPMLPGMWLARSALR